MGCHEHEWVLYQELSRRVGAVGESMSRDGTARDGATRSGAVHREQHPRDDSENEAH